MTLKSALQVSICAISVLAIAINAQTLSPAAENAKAFIIEPKDGAVVTSPVTVKFGLKNMTVIPAGVEHTNSGHHHLLVDVDKLPDMHQPIPADANHIHFGKGQTETSLELAPGKHTLQLLLGDHLHRPHDKPVLSKKITVTVKAASAMSEKAPTDAKMKSEMK